MTIEVTHFSDPGCPWAYSASPAHAVLRWRFGDQLRWRLVTIGLTEQADQYVRRGYTPAGSARGYLRFRRRGMPFATQPRARVAATGLACRAIVAARLQAPDSSYAAFRALQFAWFTTPLVLDDPDDLAVALERVDGLDVPAVLGALDSPRGRGGLPGRPRRGAHRRGLGHRGAGQGGPDRRAGPLHGAVAGLRARRRARSRPAASSPSRPTTCCSRTSTRRCERTPPPEDPLDALARLPYGLTTYEMRGDHDAQQRHSPTPAAAEACADRPRRRRRGHPRAAGGRGAVADRPVSRRSAEAIRIERRKVERRRSRR